MYKSISFIALLFATMLISGCENNFFKQPTKGIHTKNPSEIKSAGRLTFTHEAAKVSITLPAEWSYESGENGMFAFSANKDITIHFMLLHSDQLEAALTEVNKVLESKIKSLKVNPAQKAEFNGMNAIVVNGSGDGIELSFGIIDTPIPNISLFVGAWTVPEIIKKHENNLYFLLSNLKPVN